MDIFKSIFKETKKKKTKSKSKKTKKINKSKTKIKTLNNNLKYLIKENDSYNKVLISISVKVGSNNEPKSLFGMAHFLEHMLFKGTSEINNQFSLTKNIESKLGKFNGSTQNELTQYYISVPSKHTKKALQLIIKMIIDSILMCRDIELEKRVVNNEKNKRNDDIEQFLFKSSLAFHFGEKSPFGHFVNGVNSKINEFERGHFLSFFTNYYKPENLFLSIIGNIDKKEIPEYESIIKKYLSKEYLKNYEPLKLSNEEKIFNDTNQEIKTHMEFTKNYKPKTNNNKINMIFNNNLNQSAIQINFTTNGLFSENNMYDELLISILSNGMSSKFFKDVRDRLGFVYSISCNKINFKNVGIFTISFSTNHQKINIVLEYIFKVINELKKNGIDPKKLDTFKNKKSKKNFKLKTTGDILYFNEMLILSSNKEKVLSTFNKSQFNYNKMNKKTGDLYIKKLFKKENMTITIYTNKSKTINIDYL